MRGGSTKGDSLQGNQKQREKKSYFLSGVPYCDASFVIDKMREREKEEYTIFFCVVFPQKSVYFRKQPFFFGVTICGKSGHKRLEFPDKESFCLNECRFSVFSSLSFSLSLSLSFSFSLSLSFSLLALIVL